MELYPLHGVRQYMTECAEVLNEEWKRSLTARLHSLEKSCDSFPVCLVLFEKTSSGKNVVIGHSRLSDVQGQKMKSCLVESVVVKKQYRGKGYGRVIMKKTEEFAASKGYQTMYLTTHDKQDFYQHIGYEFCTPIVSLGCNILPDHLAQKLMGHMQLSDTSPATSPTHIPAKSEDICPEVVEKPHTDAKTKPTDGQCNSPPHSNPPCNVPPPPPPPSKGFSAPPPPPPVTQQKVGGTGDKTVTRWDPKLVAWMRKDLVHVV